MIAALGILETTGLTPAMVAADAMTKSADVRVLQLELNDFYGVYLKISGSISDVETAMEVGYRWAEQMHGAPIRTILRRVSDEAMPAIYSRPEFSPLIQQPVVYFGDTEPELESALTSRPGVAGSSQAPAGDLSQGNSLAKSYNDTPSDPMNDQHPMALGFLETQGFTAVFEAIDTACKAAAVEVVGKEKLGGGYVTVVIQGPLSAVTTAVETGKEKVGALGKLIAAHVIARPSESVLKLLPKL